MAWVEAVGEHCCPLGAAFPELDQHHPDSYLVEAALTEDLDLEALDREAAGDIARFDRLYTATLERIRFEAAAFMTAWDRGQIPPADLIADLRQMQGAS